MRPALRSLVIPAAILLLPACRDEPPTAPESHPAFATTATPAALVFRQVTAGDQHTCGLTRGALAYCWGTNSVGELGIGTSTGPETCSSIPCTSTPVRVVGGFAFRQVSAGSHHTCGVTPNNRLFCWGSNHLGQLGIGTGTGPEFCFGQSCSTRPIQIARGLTFRQVSAGSLHTCAVTTDDLAYCWGHTQAGATGNGTRGGGPSPIRVVGGLAFREVNAGHEFTCGVTTGGVAYCWGLNSSGQLGLGENTGPETCFTGDGFNACSMRPVRVVRSLAFRHVGAGGDHACGVTTDAIAYCWGANYGGQLGRGNSTGPEGSSEPVRVVGGLAFASVNVGQSHTCGVTTDHIAFCWGKNFRGELGNGTDAGPDTCPILDSACSTRPVRVVGGLVFSEVGGVGGLHTCGVTTTGKVYCWGDNSSGQLGDGTTRDRLRPRRVGGAS